MSTPIDRPAQQISAADAACALIARGFRVFPLYPTGWDPADNRYICTCKRGADCKSAGKHPRITKWPENATDDYVQARKWWGGQWAESGIGVACGTSGIVVVDEDGEAGFATAAALEASELGPLPPTLTVRSGRAEGGRHRYYSVRAVPPDLRPKNSAGDGLDIRSAGGYVVAPPSMHRSGRPYTYAGDALADLAPLPETWLAWANNRGAVKAGRGPGRPRKAAVEPGAGVPSSAAAMAAAAAGGATSTLAPRVWSEHDLDRFMDAVELLWAVWLPELADTIWAAPDRSLDSIHHDSWSCFVWWCQAHDLAYGGTIGREVSDAVSKRFKSYNPEEDDWRTRDRYRPGEGVGLAWGYERLREAVPDWEVQRARRRLAAETAPQAPNDCGILPQGAGEIPVDKSLEALHGSDAHCGATPQAPVAKAGVKPRASGAKKPAGSGVSGPRKLVPEAQRSNVFAALRPAGGHIDWPSTTEGERPRVKPNNWFNTRALCDGLGLAFVRDTFSGREMVQLPDGTWLEWTDNDARALVYRASELGYVVKKCELDEYTSATSSAKQRNLALDWLDTLKWDGVPRIHKLAEWGFGAAPSAYMEEASTLLMVAMVRRLRAPGSPFKLVPVLRGEQDYRKTSALVALGGQLNGRPLAVEASFDIVSSPERTLEKTQGTLITIFDEMSGYSRRESDDSKAWISRQYDRGRTPYDRKSHDVFRTFVCAGTVNHDGYLTDSTGNVRFIDIHCQQVCDTAWIEESREQLFAEAAHREAYAPDYLSLSEESREVQKVTNIAALDLCEGERRLEDALNDAAEAAGEEGVRVPRSAVWQVAMQQLEYGHRIHDPKLGRKINAALKRCGFDLRRLGGGGTAGRYWTRGAGKREYHAVDDGPGSGSISLKPVNAGGSLPPHLAGA